MEVQAEIAEEEAHYLCKDSEVCGQPMRSCNSIDMWAAHKVLQLK